MSGAQGRVALGLGHHSAGRLAEAEALYREALAEEPHNIDALHFLGVVALQRGDPARAVDLISQALSHNAANAPACSNLGLALAALGRKAEALRRTLEALALQPGYADALTNLGRLMKEMSPDSEEGRDALMILGEAHSRANELDEAADCMRRIVEQRPADANAHNLLGNVLRNQARHGEAIRHYEQAIAHDPNPVVAFQNLLFCMMCTPGISAADLHARHRDFARRFEQPLLASRPTLANPRDPERRLRIGYLSPDFRANVVGHYVQPIFANHDRGRFEIYGYFAGAGADDVTRRIAALVDHWHEVRSLSDEGLVALIREHRIDILVDLCGHGPGNRVLAFARRAAPLQVNYLDYSATTGLSSMDYRLTTEYCDPRGIADQYYSEKLWRLKDTYWTYNPSVELPVAALPSRANGYVTFGSFNLYYRITGEVLDLWSRVLQAVPRSRLVILSVAPGSTRTALLEKLGRAGIARERVDVHGVVSYEAYHQLISSVDIGLAPFPYNGATTVMDCLWNGVPVVAKAGGETFTTRLGCSVLAGVGLEELIATDNDDYVRIAARLAAAPGRLSELRQTLQRTLAYSSMRDFPGFTKSLESAYRSMWRAWCAP
jgi:predicted O-linked N-acetylglucosamine transferase (SPINDLY family)